MRIQIAALLAISASLLLGQATPLGCFPGTGDGGTGGGFNLPPTVIISADVQRGVAPLTVQFDSSASTDDGVIVERAWDFGDGTGTSPEIAPTYTFTNTGTYTVRLTLRDDRNATSTRSLVISVTERPVAVIEVDRTSAESAPAQFNFDGSDSFDPDAEAGDVLTYLWDFDDGSREVLPAVQHTFTSPGTYRVRLTVTDAVGVTGTAEKIIQIGIPQPTISFRTPSAEVRNLVVTTDSELWTTVNFAVEPGVPYMLRAGLDRDRDACDPLVAIFDADSGNETERLTDATEPIYAAAFSPNGEFVLVGSDDGRVRQFDPISSGLLRRYSGPAAEVSALAIAPDGNSFVVGYSNGDLNLLNIGSSTIVRTFVGHTGRVTGAAFSPMGEQIISADDDGVVILWNTADAAQLQQFDHSGIAVTSVAFSPSNPQRVATGAVDSTARLWNTVDGQLVQEYAPVITGGAQVAGHTGAVNAVAFSPDGAQLLTGSADKTAKLWDVATGTELRTFSGHNAAVNSVAYDPSGERVATGSDDHAALLWAVEDGEELDELAPCSSPITVVAFAPDGETLLTAVAAKADIQLDSNPPGGEDLNLARPTALVLSDVEVGRYYLWVEVDTDRTDPVRRYHPAQINLVEDFTSELDDPEPPLVPLRDDAATIITPDLPGRQIMDLGALDRGDRLYLSLVTQPGYGTTYTADDYSVLILDANDELYAWYRSGESLLSAGSKLIIGHNSNSYYLVLDGLNGEPPPSVNVRIERGYTDDSDPREQYVYLNFNTSTVTGLTVAGSSQFSLPPFNTAVAAAGFNPAQVKSGIEARLEELFGDYDFTISTTPPPADVQAYLTIYFDTTGALYDANIPDRNGDFDLNGDDLQFYGLTNFIDARNATRSGRAVISMFQLMEDFPAAASGQLGSIAGNAVAHHVGLLSGLVETAQPPGEVDDIMTVYDSEIDNLGLVFTTAPMAAFDDLDAIGIQDGDRLLTELFGN